MKSVIRDSIIYLSDFIRLVILVRVLLSWFPISRTNPFYIIVYNLSEPILAPIRRLINNSPLRIGGSFIDFSPFVAIIILQILKIIFINILYNLN